MKILEFVKAPADYELTTEEITILTRLYQESPKSREILLDTKEGSAGIAWHFGLFGKILEDDERPEFSPAVVRALIERGLLKEKDRTDPFGQKRYYGVVEERMKDFKQLNELRTQLALGTLSESRRNAEGPSLVS